MEQKSTNNTQQAVAHLWSTSYLLIEEKLDHIHYSQI
jgi:hypothetical protein